MKLLVGIRIAAGLLRLLPFSAVRRLGRWAGGIAWGRGVGAENVPRHLRRLGRGEEEAPEVLRRYGEYWAETLWLSKRRLPQIRQRLDIDGLEFYKTAHAEGRGVVYALPHTGNWEFAAILPWSLGIPLLAVAEDLAESSMTKWFTSTRATIGIEVVLADGRRRSTQRLLEGLNEGAGVALLSDRDVTGRGVEVEFFGEVTRLPGGPVSLGLSTGAPILPVACFATDRGHRLVFRPPLAIPEAPTKAERIAAGTQALAAELEALIQMDPVQWHLLQPNWPSDPGYRQ